MAVPKKRTSMSKKRIRKNIWKKKTYFSIVQSYSLAKSRSFLSGNEHPKPKGFSG
jgi:large subunit ribosomal protein L32|nr:ribosomal protein L32 [Bouteloua curtipendula]YP_009233910.1 ribosomal protein L32 [Hilaria cenchroides]YP_009245901.1 ribosomal protein L32 [Bouteloua gracilis]YP_009246237.1 ribosomal protein L32 [Hilaria rigida]YP_009451146.1 ribosomal protein L32 [Halopyrum mucronatum]YP_009453335.1 ribosomal protein L32 [Dactyloctenium aegyptium]YP_009467478.1 ribosomal protein L32 [Triodia stipoides]YP_009655446.1 ribosomal protein L32 [Tragus australianus]YP_009656091.1 ribosomal protein L32 [Dact